MSSIKRIVNEMRQTARYRFADTTDAMLPLHDLTLEEFADRIEEAVSDGGRLVGEADANNMGRTADGIEVPKE